MLHTRVRTFIALLAALRGPGGRGRGGGCWGAWPAYLPPLPWHPKRACIRLFIALPVRRRRGAPGRAAPLAAKPTRPDRGSTPPSMLRPLWPPPSDGRPCVTNGINCSGGCVGGGLGGGKVTGVRGKWAHLHPPPTCAPPPAWREEVAIWRFWAGLKREHRPTPSVRRVHLFLSPRRRWREDGGAGRKRGGRVTEGARLCRPTPPPRRQHTSAAVPPPHPVLPPEVTRV